MGKFLFVMYAALVIVITTVVTYSNRSDSSSPGYRSGGYSSSGGFGGGGYSGGRHK